MFDLYYQVSSLSEAISLLSDKTKKLKIIAGGTDLWLEYKNKSHSDLEGFIDISRISELDQIYSDKHQVIHLGPLVTHAHCVRSSVIKEHAYCLYQACQSVGSPQIRNRGTIAGNIVTGSPANDTISALMVLEAVIVVKSIRGKREIPIVELYKGVRKTIIEKDEIVIDICFKKTENTNTKSFFVKNGLRKAQAISVVNFALLYSTDNDGIITEFRIAFGSLAPTVVRATTAEKYAVGKRLTEIDREEFTNLALNHISPITDIRSTQEYRKQVVAVLVKRNLERLITASSQDNRAQRDVSLWGSKEQTYTPITKMSTLGIGSKINLELNGKKTTLLCNPGMTLLDALRNHAGLTGSKEGCGEGECGSCTVYLDGIAVLACLIPAQRAENAKVETIESLSNDKELSKIQQYFIEENAIQCGFCTPGFIMSANKLIEEIKNPNEDEIKIAISGNLCRCTGYYKIIKAIEKAAELR
jgi:carbon-monoxide dehydrogenase medium subunit